VLPEAHIVAVRMAAREAPGVEMGDFVDRVRTLVH